MLSASSAASLSVAQISRIRASGTAHQTRSRQLLRDTKQIVGAIEETLKRTENDSSGGQLEAMAACIGLDAEISRTRVMMCSRMCSRARPGRAVSDGVYVSDGNTASNGEYRGGVWRT